MGAVKFFDLDKYISTFETKYFVETGTADGEGLAYAAQFPFVKLFSTEIYVPLAESSAARFKDDYRVKVLSGHTTEKLTELFDSGEVSDSPIIFWLDAHFPGAHFGAISIFTPTPEDIKLPLEDELQLIYDKRVKALGIRDVILIDDYRIYDDERPFKGGQLKGSVHESICKFNKLEDSIKMFGETHTVEISNEGEGYISFIPK